MPGWPNGLRPSAPLAIIRNGDVPLNGSVPNDYAVFRNETRPWRDAGIEVFPSLGNHEFVGDPQKALEAWWINFPELNNRRWYSAQIGSRVYMIALDTNASLLPGSDQTRWIEKQVDGLPGIGRFRGVDHASSPGGGHSEAHRSRP